MRYVFIFLTLLIGNAYAEPVNINTDDAATISSSLKRIGPKKAEAIIQYREKNGPFKSPRDLLNIKGIGEKTLQEIEKDILISEPAPKTDQ